MNKKPATTHDGVTSLTEMLKLGSVEYCRRWSGDTHADLGGSVDQDLTDRIMLDAYLRIRELEAELAAADQIITERTAVANERAERVEQLEAALRDTHGPQKQL